MPGIVVANIPAPRITHNPGIAACSRSDAHGSAGKDVVIAASFYFQNVSAFIAHSYQYDYGYEYGYEYEYDY